MKKFIITLFILCLATINTSFAEKHSLSKSELCDFAIQALAQLITKSPETASKAAITKEQCMAISDDEINNAAKKMMEIEPQK